MFYGLYPFKENIDKFNKAMALLKEIYGDRFYSNDMLICFWKNLSFMYDEAFMEAFYSSAQNDQEKSLLWRMHTLVWAAKNALHVEGDFVECGVLKGFCSDVIFKCLDFGNQNRSAYLYDTFSEKLPEETSTAEERENWQYADNDESAYANVCDKFSAYKNVHIVQGIVPHSFEIKAPEKIAFLHMDLNSAKAEILALEYLFDRVSVGGYIVFDDFGWDINVKQAVAEIEFLKVRNHTVLELPTGQGLVVKQSA